MSDLKPVTISHLVKYEDLNHHGTLFAGRMAEWMVEACFICASRAVGRPEDVVCVQIHGMSFVKPANRGDIITVESRVAAVGSKSITVYGRVLVNDNTEPYVTSFATFVTVDREGKPYPHGLLLAREYIEQNREIHEKGKVLKK
jgi:acyl-CoA hydrolase